MLLAVLIAGLVGVVQGQICRDTDSNCRDWISTDRKLCTRGTPYIMDSCRQSCGKCGGFPRKFDVSRAPANLQQVSWLVGIWRSEHDGKAIFPTIPKFTFGEQLEFSIPEGHMNTTMALNYTINERDELHSESGYLAVRPGSSVVSLTTVMNNGFVTVEEGIVSGHRIRFRLIDIGRISFSRDLPVHDLVREWTLLDANTLQARLEMETLTHRLQEHTFIRYRKIYP